MTIPLPEGGDRSRLEDTLAHGNLRRFTALGGAT